MDQKTLAAFRASGEKDLDKFLAQQGGQNADLPPGISGYSAGASNFAGLTLGERGLTRPAPTGHNFGARIAAGMSSLAGVARNVGTSVENALGFNAATTPAPPNAIIGSRTGTLESGLNDLEETMKRRAQPVVTPTPAPAAPTAPAFDAAGYRLNADGTRSTVGDVATADKASATAQAATVAKAAADAEEKKKQAAADQRTTNILKSVFGGS